MRSLAPWASGFAICCADYLQLLLLLLLVPVLRDLCLFSHLLCAIYIASYDVSCAGCHRAPVRLTYSRRSKVWILPTGLFSAKMSFDKV